MLNLITESSNRLIALPLDSIGGISFDDEALQEELTKALTALAQARDQDKKPVQIAFEGQGQRRVRLGYVVETPVWKTSYRLLLNKEEKPKLQGWAIVENQTDNDWTNVQLSLVSGRPISFIQDLYQPLYVPRPTVEPELYASLRPQQYEEGMEQEKKAEKFDRARVLASRAPAPAAAPATPPPTQTVTGAGAMALYETPMNASASVASIASAAKVGELFQYTVGNVSLPRQKSAMIPIVTDEVETEKLSIYNQSVLPKNPLNGARLKNTTEKHLLAGPITVFEGASYAGDAQIDTLPPGQERLISFGVDQQVSVDPTKNRQDTALLTGKDKPIETTPALYRFRGNVAAGKASKLTVKEQIVNGEAIAILPTDLEALVYYSKAGEIPEDVKKALAQAIQMRRALAATQSQLDLRKNKLKELNEQQTHTAEIMKSLERNTPVYMRLVGKLNDLETEIEKVQGEIDELSKTAEQQKKELEDYLANLNVG